MSRLRCALGVAAVVLAACASSAVAQSAPCVIMSIQESKPLEYPPIAHVAHVEGNVVVLVSFAKDGSVETAHPISGSPLLISTTGEYFKGLKVNPDSGSRECPLVASFHLKGPSDVECGYEKEQPILRPAERIDLQHVSITRSNVCVTVMRDPAPWKTHHFLFFHWYSKPKGLLGARTVAAPGDASGAKALFSIRRWTGA